MNVSESSVYQDRGIAELLYEMIDIRRVRFRGLVLCLSAPLVSNATWQARPESQPGSNPPSYLDQEDSGTIAQLPK